jgi:hypothetical protein
VCKWADDLKSKTGVRRIIGVSHLPHVTRGIDGQGHTPDFSKIVHRCNASIIIIDTGISSAYGGVLSALEIVYTLHEIKPKTQPDHRQDPLLASLSAYVAQPVLGERYIEREEVHAIYPHGRTLIALEEKEIAL